MYGVGKLLLSCRKFRNFALKRINNLRIKMPITAAYNLPDRIAHRPGIFVGALAGEGIKHVGNRDNSPEKRYILPLDPVWIAGSVPALVMCQGYSCRCLQQRVVLMGADYLDT